MSRNRSPSDTNRNHKLRLSVLLACLVMGHSSAAAATVNFWLSATNQNQGPLAPTLQVLAGSTTEIEIWARPALGMNLTAFALNLVAEQTGAITFEHVEVLNPLLEPISKVAPKRHQLIYDSTVSVVSGPFSAGIDLRPDRINSFSGLTFLNGAEDLEEGGGIGPSCQDAFCKLDATGQPMWKIATARFQAGATGSSTPLFLEIATQGIWHTGEAPTETSARFGTPSDVLHEWAVPKDADPDDHRNMHMGLPDAVIQVVSVLPDADFNSDQDVDGSDFLTWQQGFGVGSTQAEGDANSSGDVDMLDLAIWQAQFGEAVSLPINAVPEPTSSALLVVLLTCLLVTIRTTCSARPLLDSLP